MKWNAAWIWHPPLEKMDNFYLYARKELSLDEALPEATLFVTAGSLYQLYINGELVGRGPNPSDPSHYYYDVYDVAARLRKGRNVVTAICYNYGAEAKGILRQNWGRGGFLCELRDARDGKAVVKTDASWKVLQAPEWDQSTQLNCTLYGDYKETYDSRLELTGWQGSGFDDANWLAPEVLGVPPVAPYTSLIEREIPFLGGTAVHPVNVFFESASVTYAWREDREIYHVQKLIPGSPFYMQGKYLEAFKTHADFSPSVILDYGRDVTGYPEIVIKDSAGGGVDVLYGESLNLVRVDRFILKGGSQTLRAFNRRTFRYMKLLFQETPKRIDIDAVNLQMNVYPVENKGAFTCSDRQLNRIWDVGRYTMQLSMLDHFVDCPWRERTIYGGDVQPENLISYYAFGDPRLNRKTLRQMFAIQYPEGALPPLGPYSGNDHFYPAWSAFFGLAFIDHYKLTGDREFLDELWPSVERLLDWTVRELEVTPVGLIGCPAPGRDKFADWLKAPKVSFSPNQNLPFYVLLCQGAALAKEKGATQAGQRYAAATEAMALAIRKHLFDENGACVSFPKSAQPVQETQADWAYLMWAELFGAQEGAAFAEKALSSSAMLALDTPFNGYFFVEGLFRYAGTQKALDYIRTYWGGMLDSGATTFWEYFSTAWPTGLMAFSSSCHGWSAGPTYLLPAYILGIRPLAAGFTKVLVAPEPGDLTWAEGAVPTPQGLVRIKWTRAGGGFQLDASSPDGCEVTVKLPVIDIGGKWLLDGKPLNAPDLSAVNIGSGAHSMALQSQ